MTEKSLMLKWKATKKPQKCSIRESFLCVFHFRDVNKGCKKIKPKLMKKVQMSFVYKEKK